MRPLPMLLAVLTLFAAPIAMGDCGSGQYVRFGALHIASNPPGAFIFSQSGQYWGRTDSDREVGRIFCSSGSTWNDAHQTIVIVARLTGYHDSVQSVPLDLVYGSSSAAEEHAEQTVIILQPSS